MALLIGEIFRRNAAVEPDGVAATLGDARLSHRELDAAGDRLAAQLRARGVGHRDRVVTFTDTGIDVLPLFVAVARLGAVFAPLNARFGGAEAADVAQLARPKLVVADAERVDGGREIAAATGASLARLGAGPAGTADFALDPGRGPEAEPVEEPALDERDTHVLFFTSGSTGRPKGVVLSHRTNWLRGYQGVFRPEAERTVCMFPLFHMAAFTLGLAAWQTRGALHLVAPPTAEALLEAVERHRANRLYCIPAVWGRILEADTERYDLSSLREVDTGTSATPPELIDALKKRFPGTVTRIYYGSTECATGAVLADADVQRKPGSVGLAPPGVELRLSDAGEICVRSETLMDGYFDDPEATGAALRDGWYHTGDLGVLDDEGYLSIVGRLKEVIRTGGESVSPSEVEAVLVDHPALAEVAVVGLPDPEWGEQVCAVAVLRAGAALELEALRQHCEGRLARFKWPRRLERVGELPRTAATGQVQRALLVERILAGG